MKEFMIIFRNEKTDQSKPLPEKMQAMVKQWQDWIGGIAALGKFISTDALGYEGQTVNANGVVSDGPYAEVKEIVGGSKGQNRPYGKIILIYHSPQTWICKKDWTICFQFCISNLMKAIILPRL